MSVQVTQHIKIYWQILISKLFISRTTFMFYISLRDKPVTSFGALAIFIPAGPRWRLHFIKRWDRKRTQRLFIYLYVSTKQRLLHFLCSNWISKGKEMRERNLYRAGGSKFHVGSHSYVGERSLVASRLAIKDCNGKSRSAPLTEGMNSSLRPSALRAEIKVCPLMLSRSLTFESKQYCVIWLSGLHCTCGVCLIFSDWRNAGDKVRANKNSLKKNAGDNAQ